MNGLFGNRYGVDRLSIVLIIIAFLFMTWIYLMPIALVLIFLAIFRMTSRNFARRQMELRKFEAVFGKVSDFLDRLFRPIVKWINRAKLRKSDKKVFKYTKCRYCKKKLRLPKDKGKIKVTCPECKNQFIIKT